MTTANPPSKRILCILLPNWPIDRARRSLSPAPERRQGDKAVSVLATLSPGHLVTQSPLVLIRTIANRQQVVAACAPARRHGIRPGLSLAEARALCPQLRFAEHDPRRDAQALEALARWMIRFTPRVAVGYDRDEPAAASKSPAAEPREIFLDLTGCDRLHGNLDTLLGQIDHALARFRLSASLALAPTPAAAWAFAFAKWKNPDWQPPTANWQLATDNWPLATDNWQLLCRLPLAALRLDDATLESLHHLGLTTIGQLLALPRDTLPARFGPLLLKRLDQFSGSRPEPLRPLTFSTPVEARLDWDGPVNSPEALWLVFQQLIAPIIAELARRGSGARQLDIQLFRPYAPPIEKTIRLSRPSRNPVNLFNLFRCALESLDGFTASRATGFQPVRSTRRTRIPEPDTGFTGLRLHVSHLERLTEDQILLLQQEEHDAQLELTHLIERLRARLGHQTLARPLPLQSHLPERAYQLNSDPSPPNPNRKSNSSNRNSEFGIRKLPPRPLHLLPQPQQVAAIVSPSDDRDGRPVSFTLAGQVHRLPFCTGPERLSGLWWEGHHRTRDYFDVEDAAGQRFWLFRVMETHKWYLHGIFE